MHINDQYKILSLYNKIAEHLYSLHARFVLRNFTPHSIT
jgi:hypothetical protein